MGATEGSKQHGRVWALRKALVGTGKAILSFLDFGNRPSCFVGPPFPVFMSCFSATASWCFLGDLIASSLIGGCC